MYVGWWGGLALAAAFVALAMLIFVVYHKLSLAIDRLGKESPKISGNVFAQIEALLALQQELRLVHALPPTRGWAASPDFLRNLMVHALRDGPRSIVECSSGVSTLVLARCMQLLGKDGHVFSLEHDAEFAEKTRQLLRQHGLCDYATVYDAPLKEYHLPQWSGKWYSHDVLPADLDIDMLVIDGPPWFVAETPRYPALPFLHGALNSQALVFLDDAFRPEEKTCVQRWLEEFRDLKELREPVCEKGCVVLQRAAQGNAVAPYKSDRHG